MALAEPIPLTDRLCRRVLRDFGAARGSVVVGLLERVDLGDSAATRPPVGRERVLAAVLERARGDDVRLQAAIWDAERDWRDALVWGGLANGDWHERLDELLGPVEAAGEDAAQDAGEDA